jgi:hypothetical protein
VTIRGLECLHVTPDSSVSVMYNPALLPGPLNILSPGFPGPSPYGQRHLGGVNPRAMGTAGTSRCPKSLTLSDAKDGVTTDSEKKLG